MFGVLLGGGNVWFFFMDKFGWGKSGIGKFFGNRERRGIFVFGGSNSFFDENFKDFGVERFDPGAVLAAAFNEGAQPGGKVVREAAQIKVVW
ncbi:MAG: hypothetical protein G01um101416_1168 [Microgenomates group bacterium Gr01-1014_16]|nr:MAG: hypothetical protein G01um101416_1168 [Microgenomates group bacterium Gr01-1014_16]